MAVRVTFWGTRGSLPAPLRREEVEDKLREALCRYRDAGSPPDVEAFLHQLPFCVRATYGGDTCCVQAEAPGCETLLLDAGTGLRRAGYALMAATPGGACRINILLSHFHWDHIQGLPFFAPAYSPNAELRLFAVQEGFASFLQTQQQAPHFPLPLSGLPARLHFAQLTAEQPAPVGGWQVTPFLQDHPGASYGYLLDAGGRRIVYATDSEYADLQPAEIRRIVDLVRGSDLLIFDAQYTLAEAVTNRAGWGHSTFSMGVDLARLAGVKRLALFHHDATSRDCRLDELLRAATEYRDLTFPEGQRCELLWAYDGLQLEV